MDSFVPALIAALLAAATDKPTWLAAILGTRWPGRGGVIFGAIAAQAALMAIAVLGALAIAAMLNPEARNLFAGIAVFAAAVGAAWAPGPPRDRLDRWRIGAAATSALGIFVLGLGERVQFAALGIAVWGSNPWLAALGAAIGASVPAVAAATLGEAAWRRLPLHAIGIGCALLLGAAGLALALGGLRIV